MTIKNNILRDYSEEDERFYLIDLITGVKAEVVIFSNKDATASLVRSEIEAEDIERAMASNIDLRPLKLAENSNEEIVQSMLKIANQIESGKLLESYPNLKAVSFSVGDYRYLSLN